MGYGDEEGDREGDEEGSHEDWAPVCRAIHVHSGRGFIIIVFVMGVAGLGMGFGVV